MLEMVDVAVNSRYVSDRLPNILLYIQVESTLDIEPGSTSITRAPYQIPVVFKDLMIRVFNRRLEKDRF